MDSPHTPTNWLHVSQKSSSLHSVTLLEFQWGPNLGLQEVYQQRRRALLQRSSRRVEEIKAKGLAKIQAPSEAREQSKAKESQPVTCKAKTKSEPRCKTNTKSKGGQAEPHQTTEKSGFIKQKKPQLPPPGIFWFKHVNHREHVSIMGGKKDKVYRPTS